MKKVSELLVLANGIEKKYKNFLGDEVKGTPKLELRLDQINDIQESINDLNKLYDRLPEGSDKSVVYWVIKRLDSIIFGL